MAKLADLAIVCRSKNAGPFELTLDVALRDCKTWQRVVDVLTASVIARLYGVAESEVLLTPYESANAIKATLPRQAGAGYVGDGDVYGAQQHAPLLMFEIEGEAT